MNIVWKPIKNCNNYYISNNGEVITMKNTNKYPKGKLLTPRLCKQGYFRVYLTKNDGTRKDFKIHRLVAKHYLEKPKGCDIVNHKDGNKTNNNVSNLEWCTHSQNNIHAYSIGLSSQKHRGKKVLINGYKYESILDASKSLKVSRTTIINRIKSGEYKVLDN